MADTPITATPTAWHHLVSLRDQIIHNPSRDQDDRLAAVENQLLNQAAPDLAGVTLKLELIWQAELHGLDEGSRQKIAILDDLRRLAA